MSKFVKFCLFTLLLFSTKSHSEDIMGVGAPIMDVLIPVEEEFLSTINIKKGDSGVITLEELKRIMSYNTSNITIKTGGSCSNTLKALAKLGHPSYLYGMIGRDEMADLYLSYILPLGITPKFLESSTPTAIVASLVTPDGERTMSAYSGASKELSGDLISESMFHGAKIVHIEGYAFYNDQLVEKAAQAAKSNGAIVSLDLGCANIVVENKEELKSIIQKYIGIVFANENEARTLSGYEDLEKACQYIHQWCPCVVVLAGKEGCYIGSDNQVSHYSTTPVNAIDTTGAGDVFISGFLHGILNGYPLKHCARIGNILGGVIVQHVGAEIPEEEWNNILTEIQKKAA